MKYAFGIVAALCVTGFVGAEDKAGPAGMWKVSYTVQETKREQTLKLKVDGNKVTGVMLGRNNQETAIEDGKFKNGEISFTVTRERNGQKIGTKYTGKLTGDSMKGKMELERDGNKESRDWEATRSKD